MFRVNERHLQAQMFSTVDALPEEQSQRLAESWAGTFYRECFSRLNEQPFAVLYSPKDSRPNIPVNVLVGLEALKAGFNWSDEEMYDAFCFDLQVRYALGYRQLGDGQFDVRTVYNFRQRLSAHMQKTGENLIERAFEQITDGQIAAFKLKTAKVRMDSSEIASNIRNMSRLHLLVEVIQRVHRMLAESDRALYADAFAPYLKGGAGQYVYRVKGEDGPTHMRRIGELMRELLQKLVGGYAEHGTYRMLQRVFGEHFVVEQDRLRLKVGRELSSESLNSPDDMEATFRIKDKRPYKGYVANVTETCDPDNPLQLIAKVQTKPNVANDDDMLIEAVPALKERLGIDEVHTDGGYNSDESYKVLRENGIEHVQTAIRGHAPHRHIGLDKFEMATSNEPDPACVAPCAQQGLDPTSEGESGCGTPPIGEGVKASKGRPMRITCPYGQTVEVEQVESKGEYRRFRAHFDTGKCSGCPFEERCLAPKMKSKPQRTLSFDEHDAEIARRRRRIAQAQQDGRNLRVAVESTIASLKHPFNYGQLPVRGLFRVGMVLLGCAAMANVRRIHRYVWRKRVSEGTIAGAGVIREVQECCDSLLLCPLRHLARLFDIRQTQSHLT